MPIKLRKKRPVGRPVFTSPTEPQPSPKRRCLKKKRKTSVNVAAPASSDRIGSPNDPALAVWDMLKPFHKDEHSIDIVMDCLSRRGMFEQTYVENPTMTVPEILKLAVAKFVLQTCSSINSKKLNIRDVYKSSKALEEKRESEPQMEKGPIIRPTYKERYEAKIIANHDKIFFFNYEIPQKIVTQYRKLMFEERLLRKLLRPQVYFDFDVKNGRQSFCSVGRIVFQIFAEACPAIVLEFVRSCASNRFRDMKIKKVFENIWLEAEFRIEKSPVLDRRYLTCNACALDHSKALGMLSFSKQIIYPNVNRETISFVISFSPLKIPVGQDRIAFGVIHRGHHVLKELQKCGTPYGKPRQRLKITKCGAINV